MVLIVVIVVVLVVLIPVVLAGILVVYLQTLPQGADNVETTLGLRSERIQTGDWVIAVVVGSHDAADVTVMVLDTAGAVVLSTRLTALNATDGAYHDNNMNGDLDAGDTILLKDTDKVDAGMKFQLLKGESIIGTIRQLPA